MKLDQAMKLLFFNKKILQNLLQLFLLSSIALLFITLLPNFYTHPLIQTQYIASLPPPISHTNTSSSPPPQPPPPPPPPPPRANKECDISRGEWVRDPEGEPRYTNNTCRFIQEHQNCIKFGRPDGEFMKWRWKPDGCELLRFDPERFLELVRGKSLAFVGDSLARNHMQSLLCLLSKVEEYPRDISENSDENNKWMFYQNYEFTVAVLWSPFLVRAQDSGPADGMPYNIVKLYLDEPDPNWLSKIATFDYVVISGGSWFNRPSLFYEKGQLVGCQYCDLRDVSRLTYRYSNKKAFRTAFRTIINRMNGYKAKTFVRTMSPNHFENGVWNDGGDCVRTAPFRREEAKWLDKTDAELYKLQAKEFAAAERDGRTRGVELKLLDTSGVMLMRPDGHPGRYGHWQEPGKAAASPNDCVHWCLPGPVDVWNDFLFHMMNV